MKRMLPEAVPIATYCAIGQQARLITLTDKDYKFYIYLSQISPGYKISVLMCHIDMFWMLKHVESDLSLKRKGPQENTICGTQLQFSRICHWLQPATHYNSLIGPWSAHAFKRQCNSWVQVFYHTNFLVSVQQSCSHIVSTENIQDLHNIVWLRRVQRIYFPLQHKKFVMSANVLSNKMLLFS